MKNKVILFTVNVDWFFLSHRLNLATEALKNGYCAVIGLQSTGESSLNYASEEQNWVTGCEVGNELLSPTYWTARRFLEEHFPTRSLIPLSKLREMEQTKDAKEKYRVLEQNELLRK